MQTKVTKSDRNAAFSSYNYNSAEEANFMHQSASRKGQVFQAAPSLDQRFSQANRNSRSGTGNQLQPGNQGQSNSYSRSRNQLQPDNQGQANSYSRSGNQLQPGNQGQADNYSLYGSKLQSGSLYADDNRQASLRSQTAIDRQTGSNAASTESTGRRNEGSVEGDIFATYGTKKERRTIRKEALIDESRERNEDSEQNRKRTENQEASIVILDINGEPSDRAAPTSLTKKAKRAGQDVGQIKENKKHRQPLREAKPIERKKERRRRAKRRERSPDDQTTLHYDRVPPPLPPKPARKSDQAVRLEAIERQLPELQSMLRMLNQERSISAGSQTKATSRPSVPSNSGYNPEPNESGFEVDAELTPNTQRNAQVPNRERTTDFNKSYPDVDENFTPRASKDVQAPNPRKDPIESEDSDPEVDEDFAPNASSVVHAPNPRKDPIESKDSDPEVDEDFAPNASSVVHASNPRKDPIESEESDPEIEEVVTPTSETNVEAALNNQSDSEPDMRDSITPSSEDSDEPEMDENIKPNAEANEQAPCDSNPTVRFRDFSQHVFSDRDTVLEEYITPEHVPGVFQPTERPEKPEKFRASEVHIPTPLDDQSVDEPREEMHEPITEIIEKSVCRLVELEPDFRWMFGDKCEQTDAIINPLVDSFFCTETNNGLAHIDASTDVQKDLLTVSTSFSTTDSVSSISKEQYNSKLASECSTIYEKEQYLSENTRLKMVVSELEKRLIVQETTRITESQRATVHHHRRTVGLMVKPPCRDVAINIYIEESKPAQRSVGVNVSVEQDKSRNEENPLHVIETPNDRATNPNSTEVIQFNRANYSKSSSTSVLSQRLMFFQSLRQTYGITATELVEIISELLKRDVKSVGLQVCLDSFEKHPDIGLDGAALDREREVFGISDCFYSRTDATSTRTSDTSSSVLSRYSRIDSTTRSASDSLSKLSLDGNKVSNSDSVLSTTEFGWQGQEENCSREFQYTSEDASVTTYGALASRHELSRQATSVSASSMRTSAAFEQTQQLVSNQLSCATQKSYAFQSETVESSSRLNGKALELTGDVDCLSSSMLQPQASFSQSFLAQSQRQLAQQQLQIGGSAVQAANLASLN